MSVGPTTLLLAHFHTHTPTLYAQAKPAKIVAGLEPELTREYMQYLAYAATR